MRKDEREAIRILEELTGSVVVLIPGSKHNKAQFALENTEQEFAIPKEFRSGCSKKNFYSGMRRKIKERVEQIKARQSQTI